MYALFNSDTVLPPTGLSSSRAQAPAINDIFRSDKESKEEKGHPELRSKGYRDVDLGGGNNFQFRQTPYIHHAARSNLSCLFAGEVGSGPGRDIMADNHTAYVLGKEGQSEATWLVDLYRASQRNGLDFRRSAQSYLAEVEGSFAFVVYDKSAHRVFAGRDSNGSQSLFWGVTDEGKLVFSTDMDDLDRCEPSATAFPAGSFFLSEPTAKAMQPGSNGWVIGSRTLPGELLSFVPKTNAMAVPGYRIVKRLPRITSKGCLNGSVFRVESERNLAGWAATC